MRFPCWPAYPLALALLAVAPVGVNAEDPPPAAKPGEKAAPEFAEIQTEWKKVIKPKNDPQFAKERALYYETKDFKGVGLFWLGNIWELARDWDKTIETFEKFLKSPEGKDANKEAAMMKIMAAHVSKKDYEKAIQMGVTVLKAYPMSGHSAQNLVEMGRTYRRWGKDDEALKKFLEAAESKSSQGVFDAIDIYLVRGDVATAKQTLTKYAEALKASTKGAVAEMTEFLNAVGTEAPKLEGAKSPTKHDVPAAFKGSWTVLIAGSVTLSNLERRLGQYESIRSAWDKADPWFIMRYDLWDPFQKKVVKELTPDQEFELQIKVMEKEGGGAHVLTVPKDLWDRLHLKSFGQRTIIDPEGKFRWTRLVEQRGTYDGFTMEKAMDTFAGAGTGGAAPAGEGGDGGGEMPGGGDAPGEK
jgi:tetratricopeptide (TPR) repeat protein